MNLPDFIWLWKIAAWSMGLSLFAYLLLAVTGVWMFRERTGTSSFPWFMGGRRNVRSLHYIIGITMVSLVLLLLAVGIVGTLGHFGSLGHSSHLMAGLIVVGLVSLSAVSAIQINTGSSWARPAHIGVNIILFGGFTWVSLTGWLVVQKYLP
ncbi:DUF4079 domain-containing protein [Nodularia chucula]|uniref:DUF4079 domain-containing protein n=1 Tax=Nodularia chucula TaxID=3093667 RepID=UPI0039C5D3FD